MSVSQIKFASALVIGLAIGEIGDLAAAAKRLQNAARYSCGGA